jgi:calcineurin-like phosphoesterase family protein
VSKIFFTSDLHFNHDREFIFGPRGFKTVQEMNGALIRNWNETVFPLDDIYVLGDFFLGTDYEYIKEVLNKLNGRIHLVTGNHDTPSKITEYTNWSNIVEIADALRIKYKKREFFLCHYPVLTASLEQDPNRAVINLFGHTHSKDKFYEDRPYMYNVAVDANNNRPVSIDEIVAAFNAKVEECIATLGEEK